jgi:hypothetical protein
LTGSPYELNKKAVEEKFKEGDCSLEQIQFVPPLTETRRKWNAERRREEEVKIITPRTLASAVDAELIANMCHSGLHSALVVWHPRNAEDYDLDGDDLRQLPYLKTVSGKTGVGVRTPIYVFHNTVNPAGWGVEIDGDPNRAYRKQESGAALWDTQSACETETELRWSIEHIAHEGETTWFGALPKVGKTWVLLLTVKALLTGEPLFGDSRLNVPRSSKRVIYLCPEAGRGSIVKRLKILGLMGYLWDPVTNPTGRLYLRTLSKGAKLALDNTALLDLTKEADIFIDTAVRYLEGDENQSGDVKVLTENVLNLISVGARSVWVAHHAPKGFENASTMTLQNMFRGSGEFGAALTNAYGLCTEDEATTTIRFHCITGRDLDEPIADLILVGRPHLKDIGNFFVQSTNAEPFKGHNNSKSGPRTDPDRQAKIEFAKNVEGSLRDKRDATNQHFGTKHSVSTYSEWLKEFDQEVTS